jgi:hypothetical protein
MGVLPAVSCQVPGAQKCQPERVIKQGKEAPENILLEFDPKCNCIKHDMPLLVCFKSAG